MFRVRRPFSLSSPVARLVDSIGQSLGNVAPQNATRLQEILDSHCVTLEVVDSARFICRAAPERSLIQISVGALDIVWCLTYASVIFYQNKIAGRVLNGEEAHIEDAATQAAMALLRWALSKLLNKVETEWPSELPSPAAVPPPESWEHVADELTLVAIAYLLLHEVAHVANKHNGTDRLAEEREADLWSVDWIFDGASSDPRVRLKLALGVALALLLTLAKGIWTHDFDGVTHPRDFDRLHYVLTRHVQDQAHIVWGILTAVLSLHLHNAKYKYPKGPFDTAWDNLEAILNYLADVEGGNGE